MPYSWSFALTSCSLILGLVGTLTEEDMMGEFEAGAMFGYLVRRKARNGGLVEQEDSN